MIIVCYKHNTKEDLSSSFSNKKFRDRGSKNNKKKIVGKVTNHFKPHF